MKPDNVMIILLCLGTALVLWSESPGRRDRNP
jgi:hypothetical protein